MENPNSWQVVGVLTSKQNAPKFEPRARFGPVCGAGQGRGASSVD